MVNRRRKEIKLVIRLQKWHYFPCWNNIPFLVFSDQWNVSWPEECVFIAQVTYFWISLPEVVAVGSSTVMSLPLRCAIRGSSRCRLRLKCDGTRAEIRFSLSAKRTSPLKLAGASFQSLLAAEVCASVVVMLDTPCSQVVWRVLATPPFASFPFPSLRHRVPSHFNWSLRTLY